VTTGSGARCSPSSDRFYFTTFVVFVLVLLFRFGSVGDAACPEALLIIGFSSVAFTVRLVVSGERGPQWRV
jgi:hypothetical protein